jgi:hypothetical protein
MLLAFAVLAWAAGSLLLIQLEIAIAWRVGLILLWTGDVGIAVRRLVRGQQRIDRIVMTSGGYLAGITPGGDREPMTLLPGSVVYRRIAWLRFRFADGHRHAELLAGNPRADRGFHGLQVIWRLGREAFGHPR